MTKPKRKKKYFPNNVDKLRKVPPEYFESIDFEDFMDWKIGGYEIPSSINCIIREQRLDTGEVTEYVYQTAGRAKRKALQIIKDGVSEFVVCTQDQIHHMYPKFIYEPYTEGEYDA